MPPCEQRLHDSSGRSVISIKRRRLRSLAALSQTFAHHSSPLTCLLLQLSVTQAWLDTRTMSSILLWWVCVFIHKQMDSNKEVLAATLGQFKHPGAASKDSQAACWVTSYRRPKFLQCVPTSSLVALSTYLFILFYLFSWPRLWIKDWSGLWPPESWIRRADSCSQSSRMFQWFCKSAWFHVTAEIWSYL